MKQVVLISDGSCWPNPGPGGWAYILRYGTAYKEAFGSAENTTNNRMELKALIEGLKALREPCKVNIISDSQYLLRGLFDYVHKWKAKDWKRKGEPIINVDLWKELYDLAAKHEITGEWIRGHTGHVDNERVDVLAAKGKIGLNSK